MAVTFQKELFVQLMPELPPLFFRHWSEVILPKERLPLDPDWARYNLMEAQGNLHIMTARADGRLIGYYFAVVVPNLHCKSALTAYSDMFYVLPEYRGSGWGMCGTGYKLIVEMEKVLRGLGVRKSYLVTKAHLPITIILKRLKYFLVERLYVKLF